MILESPSFGSGNSATKTPLSITSPTPPASKISPDARAENSPA